MMRRGHPPGKSLLAFRLAHTRPRPRLADGGRRRPASPRGAAALLRVATEKLCKELGDSEQGPRPTITPLLQEEVDARVLKVLEAMRVIESNAMPSDHVSVRDDRATAETLSGLVNLICEKMMIEPRQLQALYTKVREGAQNGIEQRAQRIS